MSGRAAPHMHRTHRLTPYPDSYTPSQADVSVYESAGKAPDAGKYPHAARWYEHIESYKAEHKSLSGDAAKAIAALA